MLVMSQQFTITLEQRFEVLRTYLAVDNYRLQSNHELQIIADFIVIN